MSESVIAKGEARLEAEDFARAYREVPGLGGRRWLLPGVVLAMVCLHAVNALRTDGDYLVAGGTLLWGAVVAAAGHWVIGYMQRRGFARMPDWQKRLRYEVDERGARILTDRSSVEIAWTALAGWRESDHAFYLRVQGANMVHLVIKRAFASTDEIAAIRGSLERHAGPGTLRMGRSRGTRTLLLWLALIAAAILAYQALVPPG
ncbi:MAG: YcxB family protein [Sandaracinaceae bacterium]|nr:YcxB family protein [Sandaracinaceae bacterium]